MPVETQYYVPEVEKNEKSEEVSQRIETFFESCGEVLAKSRESVRSSEENITFVLHAPYSFAHIERTDEYPKSAAVTDAYGVPVRYEAQQTEAPNQEKLEGSGQFYAMPLTEEIGGEALQKVLQGRLDELSDPTRLEIVAALDGMRNDTLYGEYHPVQLGTLPDGTSIDPAKFLTSFALEVAHQKNVGRYSGEVDIVLHPDVLLFLGQGDSRKIKEKAQSVDKLFTALNLKVMYENVVFGSQTIRQGIPWMEDPVALSQLLSQDAKSSGVCIDTYHLERLGWDAEKITGAIEFLDKRSSLVIHTQNANSATDSSRPYLAKCYRLGVPVVYEDRSA